MLQEEFQVKDYLIMCVYGLIVLVSLFGNFLVFSVILRTRRLVLQKVPSEANPKVCNHGEGPY